MAEDEDSSDFDDDDDDDDGPVVISRNGVTTVITYKELKASRENENFKNTSTKQPDVCDQNSIDKLNQNNQLNNNIIEFHPIENDNIINVHDSGVAEYSAASTFLSPNYDNKKVLGDQNDLSPIKSLAQSCDNLVQSNIINLSAVAADEGVPKKSPQKDAIQYAGQNNPQERNLQNYNPVVRHSLNRPANTGSFPELSLGTTDGDPFQPEHFQYRPEVVGVSQSYMPLQHASLQNQNQNQNPFINCFLDAPVSRTNVATSIGSQPLINEYHQRDSRFTTESLDVPSSGSIQFRPIERDENGRPSAATKKRRIINPDRNFKCKFCDKAYVYQTGLTKHENIAHSEKDRMNIKTDSLMKKGNRPKTNIGVVRPNTHFTQQRTDTDETVPRINSEDDPLITESSSYRTCDPLTRTPSVIRLNDQSQSKSSRDCSCPSRETADNSSSLNAAHRTSLFDQIANKKHFYITNIENKNCDVIPDVPLDPNVETSRNCSVSEDIHRLNRKAFISILVTTFRSKKKYKNNVPLIERDLLMLVQKINQCLGGDDSLNSSVDYIKGMIFNDEPFESYKLEVMNSSDKHDEHEFTREFIFAALKEATASFNATDMLHFMKDLVDVVNILNRCLISSNDLDVNMLIKLAFKSSSSDKQLNFHATVITQIDEYLIKLIFDKIDSLSLCSCPKIPPLPNSVEADPESLENVTVSARSECSSERDVDTDVDDVIREIDHRMQQVINDASETLETKPDLNELHCAQTLSHPIPSRENYTTISELVPDTHCQPKIKKEVLDTPRSFLNDSVIVNISSESESSSSSSEDENVQTQVQNTEKSSDIKEDGSSSVVSSDKSDSLPEVLHKITYSNAEEREENFSGSDNSTEDDLIIDEDSDSSSNSNALPDLSPIKKATEIPHESIDKCISKPVMNDSNTVKEKRENAVKEFSPFSPVISDTVDYGMLNIKENVINSSEHVRDQVLAFKTDKCRTKIVVADEKHEKTSSSESEVEDESSDSSEDESPYLPVLPQEENETDWKIKKYLSDVQKFHKNRKKKRGKLHLSNSSKASDSKVHYETVEVQDVTDHLQDDIQSKLDKDCVVTKNDKLIDKIENQSLKSQTENIETFTYPVSQSKRKGGFEIYETYSIERQMNLDRLCPSDYLLRRIRIIDAKYKTAVNIWEILVCLVELFDGLSQEDKNMIISFHPHFSPMRNRANVIECQTCELSFLTINALEAHLQNIHLDHEVYCRYCRAVFKGSDISIDSIKKHVITEVEFELHIRKYVCSKCGERFTTKRCRDIHEDKHNFIQHTKFVAHNKGPPMKYKCDFCTRSFGSLQNLRNHAVRHTNQINKIKCDVCQCQFVIKHDLERHEAVHKRRIPLKCVACRKGFISRNSMQGHFLKCPGSRFHCVFCGLNFTRKMDYTIHISQHSASNPSAVDRCNRCEVNCKNRKGFLIHQKVMHFKRSYRCSKCSYFTSDVSTFHRHRKSHLKICTQCNMPKYSEYHKCRQIFISVKYIHSKYSSSHIKQLFGKFGYIRKFGSLPVPNHDLQVAFIQYRSRNDHLKVIQEVNGRIIYGREVKLKEYIDGIDDWDFSDLSSKDQSSDDEEMKSSDSASVSQSSAKDDDSDSSSVNSYESDSIEKNKRNKEVKKEDAAAAASNDRQSSNRKIILNDESKQVEPSNAVSKSQKCNETDKEVSSKHVSTKYDEPDSSSVNRSNNEWKCINQNNNQHNEVKTPDADIISLNLNEESNRVESNEASISPKCNEKYKKVLKTPEAVSLKHISKKECNEDNLSSNDQISGDKDMKSFDSVTKNQRSAKYEKSDSSLVNHISRESKSNKTNKELKTPTANDKDWQSSKRSMNEKSKRVESSNAVSKSQKCNEKDKEVKSAGAVSLKHSSSKNLKSHDHSKKVHNQTGGACTSSIRPASSENRRDRRDKLSNTSSVDQECSKKTEPKLDQSKKEHKKAVNSSEQKNIPTKNKEDQKMKKSDTSSVNQHGSKKGHKYTSSADERLKQIPKKQKDDQKVKQAGISSVTQMSSWKELKSHHTKEETDKLASAVGSKVTSKISVGSKTIAVPNIHSSLIVKDKAKKEEMPRDVSNSSKHAADKKKDKTDKHVLTESIKTSKGENRILAKSTIAKNEEAIQRSEVKSKSDAVKTTIPCIKINSLKNKDCRRKSEEVQPPKSDRRQRPLISRKELKSDPVLPTASNELPNKKRLKKDEPAAKNDKRDVTRDNAENGKKSITTMAMSPDLSELSSSESQRFSETLHDTLQSETQTGDVTKRSESVNRLLAYALPGVRIKKARKSTSDRSNDSASSMNYKPNVYPSPSILKNNINRRDDIMGSAALSFIERQQRLRTKERSSSSIIPKSVKEVKPRKDSSASGNFVNPPIPEVSNSDQRSKLTEITNSTVQEKLSGNDVNSINTMMPQQSQSENNCPKVQELPLLTEGKTSDDSTRNADNKPVQFPDGRNIEDEGPNKQPVKSSKLFPFSASSLHALMRSASDSSINSQDKELDKTSDGDVALATNEKVYDALPSYLSNFVVQNKTDLSSESDYMEICTDDSQSGIDEFQSQEQNSDSIAVTKNSDLHLPSTDVSPLADEEIDIHLKNLSSKDTMMLYKRQNSQTVKGTRIFKTSMSSPPILSQMQSNLDTEDINFTDPPSPPPPPPPRAPPSPPPPQSPLPGQEENFPKEVNLPLHEACTQPQMKPSLQGIPFYRPANYWELGPPPMYQPSSPSQYHDPYWQRQNLPHSQCYPTQPLMYQSHYSSQMQSQWPMIATPSPIWEGFINHMKANPPPISTNWQPPNLTTGYPMQEGFQPSFNKTLDRTKCLLNIKPQSSMTGQLPQTTYQPNQKQEIPPPPSEVSKAPIVPQLSLSNEEHNLKSSVSKQEQTDVERKEVSPKIARKLCESSTKTPLLPEPRNVLFAENGQEEQIMSNQCKPLLPTPILSSASSVSCEQRSSNEPLLSAPLTDSNDIEIPGVELLDLLSPSNEKIARKLSESSTKTQLLPDPIITSPRSVLCAENSQEEPIMSNQCKPLLPTPILPSASSVLCEQKSSNEPLFSAPLTDSNDMKIPGLELLDLLSPSNEDISDSENDTSDHLKKDVRSSIKNDNQRIGGSPPRGLLTSPVKADRNRILHSDYWNAEEKADLENEHSSETQVSKISPVVLEKVLEVLEKVDLCQDDISPRSPSPEPAAYSEIQGKIPEEESTSLGCDMLLEYDDRKFVIVKPVMGKITKKVIQVFLDLEPDCFVKHMLNNDVGIHFDKKESFLSALEFNGSDLHGIQVAVYLNDSFDNLERAELLENLPIDLKPGCLLVSVEDGCSELLYLSKFKKFGFIISAKFSNNYCDACITYMDIADASEAYTAMNGNQINGKRVTIDPNEVYHTKEEFLAFVYGDPDRQTRNDSKTELCKGALESRPFSKVTDDVICPDIFSSTDNENNPSNQDKLFSSVKNIPKPQAQTNISAISSGELNKCGLPQVVVDVVKGKVTDIIVKTFSNLESECYVTERDTDSFSMKYRKERCLLNALQLNGEFIEGHQIAVTVDNSIFGFEKAALLKQISVQNKPGFIIVDGGISSIKYDIEIIFKDFGWVTNFCYIDYSQRAFISYMNIKDALQAYSTMNGKYVGKWKLSVSPDETFHHLEVFKHHGALQKELLDREQSGSVIDCTSVISDVISNNFCDLSRPDISSQEDGEIKDDIEVPLKVKRKSRSPKKREEEDRRKRKSLEGKSQRSRGETVHSPVEVKKKSRSPKKRMKEERRKRKSLKKRERRPKSRDELRPESTSETDTPKRSRGESVHSPVEFKRKSRSPKKRKKEDKLKIKSLKNRERRPKSHDELQPESDSETDTLKRSHGETVRSPVEIKRKSRSPKKRKKEDKLKIKSLENRERRPKSYDELQLESDSETDTPKRSRGETVHSPVEIKRKSRSPYKRKKENKLKIKSLENRERRPKSHDELSIESGSETDTLKTSRGETVHLLKKKSKTKSRSKSRSPIKATNKRKFLDRIRRRGSFDSISDSETETDDTLNQEGYRGKRSRSKSKHKKNRKSKSYTPQESLEIESDQSSIISKQMEKITFKRNFSIGSQKEPPKEKKINKDSKKSKTARVKGAKQQSNKVIPPSVLEFTDFDDQSLKMKENPKEVEASLDVSNIDPSTMQQLLNEFTEPKSKVSATSKTPVATSLAMQASGQVSDENPSIVKQSDLNFISHSELNYARPKCRGKFVVVQAVRGYLPYETIHLFANMDNDSFVQQSSLTNCKFFFVHLKKRGSLLKALEMNGTMVQGVQVAVSLDVTYDATEMLDILKKVPNESRPGSLLVSPNFEGLDLDYINVFRTFGFVTSMRFVGTFQGNKRRREVVVTFMDIRDAAKAFQKLDRTCLNGNLMKIKPNDIYHSSMEFSYFLDDDKFMNISGKKKRRRTTLPHVHVKVRNEVTRDIVKKFSDIDNRCEVYEIKENGFSVEYVSKKSLLKALNLNGFYTNSDQVAVTLDDSIPKVEKASLWKDMGIERRQGFLIVEPCESYMVNSIMELIHCYGWVIDEYVFSKRLYVTYVFLKDALKAYQMLNGKQIGRIKIRVYPDDIYHQQEILKYLGDVQGRLFQAEDQKQQSNPTDISPFPESETEPSASESDGFQRKRKKKISDTPRLKRKHISLSDDNESKKFRAPSPDGRQVYVKSSQKDKRRRKVYLKSSQKDKRRRHSSDDERQLKLSKSKAIDIVHLSPRNSKKRCYSTDDNSIENKGKSMKSSSRRDKSCIDDFKSTNLKKAIDGKISWYSDQESAGGDCSTQGDDKAEVLENIGDHIKTIGSRPTKVDVLYRCSWDKSPVVKEVIILEDPLAKQGKRITEDKAEVLENGGEHFQTIGTHPTKESWCFWNKKPVVNEELVSSLVLSTEPSKGVNEDNIENGVCKDIPATIGSLPAQESWCFWNKKAVVNEELIVEDPLAPISSPTLSTIPDKGVTEDILEKGVSKDESEDMVPSSEKNTKETEQDSSAKENQSSEKVRDSDSNKLSAGAQMIKIKNKDGKFFQMTPQQFKDYKRRREAKGKVFSDTGVSSYDEGSNDSVPFNKALSRAVQIDSKLTITAGQHLCQDQPVRGAVPPINSSDNHPSMIAHYKDHQQLGQQQIDKDFIDLAMNRFDYPVKTLKQTMELCDVRELPNINYEKASVKLIPLPDYGIAHEVPKENISKTNLVDNEIGHSKEVRGTRHNSQYDRDQVSETGSASRNTTSIYSIFEQPIKTPWKRNDKI